MWELVYGLKCVSIVGCGQKRSKNAIPDAALEVAMAMENSLQHEQPSREMLNLGSVFGPH